MLEKPVYIPLKAKILICTVVQKSSMFKNLKKNHAECKEALPKRVYII